ncbi:transposase [Thermosipho ferrireducens]|uniref:Transposase n=1 Tax=Thermosipho ferrireducens TaxID=2571116 RepID=A0ABX7S474_9BACT|nr:transposase [Thermosipho ferrireducens]QTA37224.1 transposase [Thermosipho ferrireducens]
MRRRNIKKIFKLIQKFYKNILPQLPQKSTNRGRPRKYSDVLILSLAVLKELLGLSFRETLEIGTMYFNKVPSLRDFHYRVLQLEEIIKHLINFIHNTLQCEIESIIVDGTGIGFKKHTTLNWMRGTYVRQIKNHVRCEVVLTKGKYKLFQYVEVGKAYSSEIKLLKKLLKKIELKGKKFIADKLYDVKWLREYLKKRGIKEVIKIRKRAIGRKEVDYEEYKERNEIEGLFGNIKTKLGGYVYAYREDMARIQALIKFLLYNLYVAYIFLFTQLWNDITNFIENHIKIYKFYIIPCKIR